MLDTALQAVKDLERMGASEAEGYIQDSTEVIISVKDKEWSKRRKKDTCIGLRTLTGKKKGFAAGTLPMCSLEEIEKLSFMFSQNTPADPSWEHLPYSKPCYNPEGIYDRTLAEMSEEEVMDKVQVIMNAVREKGGSAEPNLLLRVDRIAVANSYGVEGFYQSTKLDFACLCRVEKREKREESMAAVEWHSRAFDVDLEGLVTTAEQLEPKNFSAIKKSFTGEAVFLPDAVAHIFLPCIKWAVHAENVYSGRSRFAEKGEVSSPVLTITDDGTLPTGVRSAPFDGEGNPMQKTTLVEKGIFQNALHSEYTANKYGDVSTGNALRSATTEPSVDTTNTIMKPGDHSVDALVEQVDEGVLIRNFSGDVDPSRGYFDGRADGSYINHGEIEFHVKTFHIRGNAFESLLNIVLVGKNQVCTSDGKYLVPFLTSEIEIIQGS